MPRIRIASCQLNTVVGDLDGNVERILAALDEAEEQGADIAVFPELAITGYPPEDLLLKPRFVADNLGALDKVAARTGRCAAVVGFVDPGRDLFNAAAVCANGTVQGVYRKRLVMMRQRLRREHPHAAEAEIEARIVAWLRERPGAEHGDAAGRPVSWPRQRS
jgi:predicted amidohydrolase